jgi:hypothetical protein
VFTLLLRWRKQLPLGIYRSESQFLLLNTRHNTNEDKDRQQNGGPELDFEHTDVVSCLSCAADSGEKKHEYGVAAVAVIFPNGLSLLVSAVETWGCPHGEADKVLEQEYDGCDDTQVSVNGVEVRLIVGYLVVLDDDNSGSERQEGKKIEGSMNPLTSTLLLCSVGRLEREDGLNEDQDAKRLGQWMAREEDNRLGEDAGPDEDKEENSSRFSDQTSTEDKVLEE